MAKSTWRTVQRPFNLNNLKSRAKSSPFSTQPGTPAPSPAAPTANATPSVTPAPVLPAPPALRARRSKFSPSRTRCESVAKQIADQDSSSPPPYHGSSTQQTCIDSTGPSTTKKRKRKARSEAESDEMVAFANSLDDFNVDPVTHPETQSIHPSANFHQSDPWIRRMLPPESICRPPSPPTTDLTNCPARPSPPTPPTPSLFSDI
ncbi:hypothetical protein B9479_007893 [Cryptococcus floricola]|uniref:Uncharacterized protein n=1 Tax=Cryptococcus floricola TaxID=2591691 RepID=A0A5D3AIY7_9TREE|nr:hypothetical protein B9479_007893 [Cryptococcus floricola]